MKQIILAVILLGIIGGVVYWRGQQNKTKVEVPPVGDNLSADQFKALLSATPTVIASEPQAIFKTDAGTIEIRSRVVDDVTYYQLTAQFPKLDEGDYAVWIENEKAGDLISLGKFSEEKGGLFIEFQTKGQVKGYDTFMVTHELRDDSKPEQVIFRGKLPEGR